jgi:hypothetical protein
VEKYTFDTNKFKSVVAGEYLAKFKTYLPTDDKSIIYGIDLIFKVAAKA